MSQGKQNRVTLRAMFDEYLSTIKKGNDDLLTDKTMSENSLADTVQSLFAGAHKRLAERFANEVPHAEESSLVKALDLSDNPPNNGDFERLAKAVQRALKEKSTELNDEHADVLVRKAVRLGLGLPANASRQDLMDMLGWLREQEKNFSLTPLGQRLPWRPHPLVDGREL